MYSSKEGERMMEFYNKYASVYNNSASLLKKCNKALETYKKADAVIRKCEKMLELVKKYSKPSPTIKRGDESPWVPEDFFETDIERGYNSNFKENN